LYPGFGLRTIPTWTSGSLNERIPEKTMSLVFFDFDGTLTNRDTIFPLCLFLARAKPNRWKKTTLMLFMFGLLKSRVITNDRFKRGFCRELLAGDPVNKVGALSKQFVDENIQNVVNRPVLDKLQGHRQQGDEVYLVSSNFGFVLRPLRKAWNISGLIATEAEVKSGRYTGKLVGRVCDGQEKLNRVLERFGHDPVREATAYGDSRGDYQLLAFVSNPVWI
jgi:phosphatidylglycerophosphatase C